MDNALQRLNLAGKKGDTAEGRSRLISLLSAGPADPALNLFEDIERRIHKEGDRIHDTIQLLLNAWGLRGMNFRL